MTREERAFTVALLVSIGAHAFFTGLFFSLPEKGPEEKVVVYTVRILEVPARPKVRQLSLSTSAISALKLQSPTLNVNPRPSGEPAPPGLADADLIPKTGPSFKGLPAPKAMSSFKGLPVPKARPSLLPPPPKSRKSARRDFRKPAPRGVMARPKDALPGNKSVFPKLPKPPKRLSPPLPSDTPRPSQTRPVLRRPAPPPLPPARKPGRRPPSKSLMERTRERVQTLKLDIQATPPLPKISPISPSAGERNLVSLRRYSNSVARAVKKDYTFPGSGGFKSSLRARMRLAINRDGSVRSIDILESSGNRTFDQVVCRSKIFKAKMPPVPEEIPDDPLVLMITCKP
ncbi:MAG: TonB C-terminal domain-containing protein [bacterium]